MAHLFVAAVHRDVADVGAGLFQPPCSILTLSFAPSRLEQEEKMTAKFLLALLCYNFTFLAIIKGALTSMVSKTIQLLILILTTLQVYSKKMKTVLKNQQFSSMHK